MTDVGATGRCPVLAGFNPLVGSMVGEPFEMLARARREMPVFYIPELDLWCVTRMSEFLEVFKDTETYSNSHEGVGRPPAEFKELVPEGHPVSYGLDGMDPPAHTHVRRLAQKAFTPRHSEARAGEIRGLCMGLIDAFVGAGDGDLVALYNGPIPPLVLMRVLGLEDTDVPRMKQWVGDWLGIWLGDDDPAETRRRWERTVEFDRFIRTFVEDRRVNPRGDLTSDLIAAVEADGSQMTQSEVVGTVATIVAAGTDTTSILLTYAVWLMLREPRHWERAKAEPAYIPRVVEETLRLRNPVRGLRRVTTRPVTLGGVDIPADASLYMHVGSANRDEAVFEDPETFNPERPNLSDHVGFGKWTHFCLGAPLARVEARVALECLVERLPDLRLVDPDQGLDYVVNAVVPAPRSLPVRWGS